MAALRRWSAEAAGGRGRLVLCSGEPGVGRTRLAAAVAAHARSAGAATGWGHCLDGDGSVPFLEAARPARSAGRVGLVAEAALVLDAVGDPGLLAPVRDLCEEALAA